MIWTVLFFAIAGIVFLIALYYSLDIGDEAEVADVIIIPEGPGYERSIDSSNLLRQKFSRSGKMIVTAFYNPGKTTDYRPIYFDREGLACDEIIQENKATSTMTNAIYSLELMEEYGFKSAIVISSDYHIRRVRWCFDKVNREQGYSYDFTYVSAYPKNKEGAIIPYTKSPWRRKLARAEVVKNVGYWLRLYHWIDL